jgi:hypothetical protein
MLATYSELARILTERYHLDPPVRRQQIHAWYSRETKNARGEPFPREVEAVPRGKRDQLRFDPDAVIRWYLAGPDPNGRVDPDSWRQPAAYRARHRRELFVNTGC